MKQARPVGLSSDGEYLVLVTDDGDHIHVPADQRLTSAIAKEDKRGPETQMSISLTPREIQTRIRAGASVADVAKAAGVPEERIEAYAAPVLAEREYLASVAQTSPVRRTGETTSHRQLRREITDQIAATNVDPESLQWDAWRVQDRKWVVQVSFVDGGCPITAQFLYDQRGRFSIAHNDAARELLDDMPVAKPAAAIPTVSILPTTKVPAAKPRPAIDPDNEPTVDFSEEFALVEAAGVQAKTDRFPVFTPVDEDELGEDINEPTLTRINGVYDFAPNDDEGELDKLLGMLRSYSEDSVEIYPDLDEVRPIGSTPTRLTSAPTPVQPQPQQPTTHEPHTPAKQQRWPQENTPISRPQPVEERKPVVIPEPPAAAPKQVERVVEVVQEVVETVEVRVVETPAADAQLTRPRKVTGSRPAEFTPRPAPQPEVPAQPVEALPEPELVTDVPQPEPPSNVVQMKRPERRTVVAEPEPASVNEDVAETVDEIAVEPELGVEVQPDDAPITPASEQTEEQVAPTQPAAPTPVAVPKPQPRPVPKPGPTVVRPPAPTPVAPAPAPAKPEPSAATTPVEAAPLPVKTVPEKPTLAEETPAAETHATEPEKSQQPAAVAPAEVPVSQPEAETLTAPEEPAAQEQPAPKPAPKPKTKKRRAAVPSWDEIMFGSPKN